MIVKFCELSILKIENETEENIQECGLQGEMIACCALQLKIFEKSLFEEITVVKTYFTKS